MDVNIPGTIMKYLEYSCWHWQSSVLWWSFDVQDAFMLQCTYYFLQDTIPNDLIIKLEQMLGFSGSECIGTLGVFAQYIHYQPWSTDRNRNIRLGTYRTKVRVNIKAIDGTWLYCQFHSRAWTEGETAYQLFTVQKIEIQRIIFSPVSLQDKISL